jgi:hypothetical protein
MSRWVRVVVWSTWLIGLGSLAWLAYLDNSYAAHMPRTSDVIAGRTVSMYVRRGTKIFVTPEEAARFDRARSRMKLGVLFCVFGTVAATAAGKGRYE